MARSTCLECIISSGLRGCPASLRYSMPETEHGLQQRVTGIAGRCLALLLQTVIASES